MMNPQKCILLTLFDFISQVKIIIIYFPSHKIQPELFQTASGAAESMRVQELYSNGSSTCAFIGSRKNNSLFAEKDSDFHLS